MICIVNITDVKRFCDEPSIMHRLTNDIQRTWMHKAVLRHVLTTTDHLLPATPLEHEREIRHVQIAIANGQELFRFSPSRDLSQEVRYVADWLSGLEDREPGRARRINRMTFRQALAASREWHRRMAREAENMASRAIQSDPEGAPVVLQASELGEGWNWVWLKTPEARKLEGDSMGHCVGNGGYEQLTAQQGIFSLRDPDDVPQVTIELTGLELSQAVAKGNSDIPARYRKSVSDAQEILGLRLLANRDPEEIVGDGVHKGERRLTVVNNKLHSEDGPAIIDFDGSQHWFFEGKRHRNKGPAVIRETDHHSKKMWYQHGHLHRENGPALVAGADGKCLEEWYAYGKLHRENEPAIIHQDGTIEYYRDGRCHRVDGPAIIGPDGSEFWYFSDQLHRIGSPAAIYVGSRKEWYVDGKLHRVDGPAVEFEDDSNKNTWFLNGKEIDPPSTEVSFRP